MGITKKNIRLKELFDAKNTLTNISQRNNYGFSSSQQSLNDLFAIEYMSKKLNLCCKKDVEQIRKATQDYMNGKLNHNSFSKMLFHYGKKAGINLSGLIKENTQEINQIFPNKQNKTRNVSLNQIFPNKQNKTRNVSLNQIFPNKQKKTITMKKNIQLSNIFQKTTKKKKKASLKNIFGGL